MKKMIITRNKKYSLEEQYGISDEEYMNNIYKILGNNITYLIKTYKYDLDLLKNRLVDLTNEYKTLDFKKDEERMLDIENIIGMNLNKIESIEKRIKRLKELL